MLKRKVSLSIIQPTFIGEVKILKTSLQKVIQRALNIQVDVKVNVEGRNVLIFFVTGRVENVTLEAAFSALLDNIIEGVVLRISPGFGIVLKENNLVKNVFALGKGTFIHRRWNLISTRWSRRISSQTKK